LWSTSANAVVQHERLRTEIYGPAVLEVPCAAPRDLLAVARSLHGHLTATVHGDGDDFRGTRSCSRCCVQRWVA
jgi:NADP-dependent aldehyde dehydrogenase